MYVFMCENGDDKETMRPYQLTLPPSLSSLPSIHP